MFTFRHREVAIASASLYFIRELCRAGDAEGLSRVRPKLAKELLEKADKAMDTGWEILLNADFTDREAAQVRHETHCAYAKRMGWDTEKPVYVFDRAYIIQ